jgi:hypothetical protein
MFKHFLTLAAFFCGFAVSISFAQEVRVNNALPVNFPKLRVITKNSPAPGNIFLTSHQYIQDQSVSYLLIVDNDGNVVTQKSTDSSYALDFKPQAGFYTYSDESANKSYSMDQRYFIILDSFEAVNYQTDGHEFLLCKNGSYFVLGQKFDTVDLSTLVDNGSENALVTSSVVQEFNPKKEKVFEWKASDYFQITDALHEYLQGNQIDFTHCNSIDVDSDSSIILSFRNLDEVTKISRKDGHIVWRFGGVNNEFKIINDSLRFSYQHAVHHLPGGNLIMFDNGTFHNTSQVFSRGVEYHLDEVNKTATKVWEYHHSPEVFGKQSGSVQLLPNGNRLICWGSCDSATLTEVKPDGSVALEMRFDPGVYSYRAYKYTDDEIRAMSGVSAETTPSSLSLDQNYPNPFSKHTGISFRVGACGPVRLAVFDAKGNEVKILFNGILCSGEYTAQFDAEHFPTGEYFYQLTSASGVVTKKCILLR